MMVLLLILLVSSIGFVSAKEIDSYEIKVNLVNGKSIVNHNLNVDTPGNLELELPEDAKILDISNKDYVFEEGTLNVFVDKELELEYLTKEFVDKADKNYFLADFPLPQDVKNFKLIVILPEGATLDDPNSVFPKPEITTDGVNIILNWKGENLKAGETFPVFMAFKDKRSNFVMVIVFAVIVAIILSVLLGFNLKRRRVKSREKKIHKKVPEKELHLLESESMIVNVLRKEGGEMWQKQIGFKTGFSKAKLSRVIRDLESRKLIKRIPLGNTNKIKLI